MAPNGADAGNLPIRCIARQCRVAMKPMRRCYERDARVQRSSLLPRQTHREDGETVMELHEIRYFLALSKTLNFTKAAEMCNVSQPALTRAIQKMEDELGGLLFSRERNNTHLTELGRMLEPHLTEVLTRTQAAKETAQAVPASGQRAPEARCHVHDRPGAVRQLPEPLSRRQSRNRDHADGSGARPAVRSADEGRAGRGADRATGRICRRRCSHNRSIGNASSSPARPAIRSHARMRCSIAELDGQPYLARINCEYFDTLRDTCHANGSHLVGAFRSEREDWILTMVAAGMGICFLPEFSNTIPGVISRPVIEPAIEREVCLVTVAGRRWSSPLSAFVRAVRQYRWPEEQQSDLPVAEAA